MASLKRYGRQSVSGNSNGRLVLTVRRTVLAPIMSHLGALQELGGGRGEPACQRDHKHAEAFGHELARMCFRIVDGSHVGPLPSFCVMRRAANQILSRERDRRFRVALLRSAWYAFIAILPRNVLGDLPPEDSFFFVFGAFAWVDRRSRQPITLLGFVLIVPADGHPARLGDRS